MQIWIKSNSGYLSGLIHYSKSQKSKECIILLSGFSQPKCDTHYLMSKMATELIKNEKNVLLIDLFGHGDSEGDLSFVDTGTMLDDLQAVIDYLKKQDMDKYYIVTRGIIGNVLYKSNISDVIERLIMINPYYGNNNTSILNRILSCEETDIDVTRVMDSLSSEDCSSLTNILHQFGAEITNVESQVISRNFLSKVEQLALPRIISQKKSLSTTVLYLSNKKIHDALSYQLEEIDVSIFTETSLVEEPEIHYKLIKNIVSILTNDGLK